MTTQALAGYRVLELAHFIAGPVCGLYLADMGADVIKVEAPGGGDNARTMYDAATVPGGDSTVFLATNRNKRSVAVDLTKAEGRAAFLRLVASADVVIEAYRGGVAERLGIGYEACAAANPRIIYCSLSAFGPTGPFRAKPGLDMLVQALGGIMSVTGDADGGPLLCGTPVIDTMGALATGQAVVTALLHRERTGQGQRIDVALLDQALLANAARLIQYLATGEEAGRHGSAHPFMVPFQAFEAKDGWLYAAVWHDRLWAPFCAAVERPELERDPRFADRPTRFAHREELRALLRPIFRERTIGEWMQRLEAADVLCTPVNGFADLPRDPQVQAGGMLVEEEHPRAGRFTTLGPAVRFTATPGTRRTPAPALGEHTDAVLAEAGLAPDEIHRLRASGVI
ncbi:MAG: CoA transferase [Candidatus Rokubacteria bacterium]|nr:CoA transferase [Candidatus Rokubacteria bacterium]